MFKRLSALLVILFLGLVLIGCKSTQPTPTPSETDSKLTEPTETVTPSETVVPTVTEPTETVVPSETEPSPTPSETVVVSRHMVVFANTEFDPVEVSDGQKVTQPEDPEKEGFVFVGWYEDENFVNVFDFDQEIKDNTIIYAHFYHTIAKVLEEGLSLAHNTVSSEKYYVKGTIKSIANTEWGNMTITDGENDIFIYGLHPWGGEGRYDSLDPRPVIGDIVYVYAPAKRFNDDVELNTAWLVKFEQQELPPFDASEYEETTTAEAKNKPVLSKVIVEGVVAKITYATGKKPNGIFLIDETGVIYIHDYDVASSVNEGDLIKVAGIRQNFILVDEVGFAAKHGYEGAIQLDTATLVERISTQTSYATDWIEEISIKELMDTDPREKNITGNIYKVNAFVKEAPGSGFTNYYFNDLDNFTGSYAYSMNNGSDFEWVREYDGQLQTMYIAVINAKSTVSKVIYRFIPIEFLGEYEYDQDYNAEYAVKFVGLPQFLDKYIVSPNLELQTNVSAEHLNFENATLSYHSNNESVLYFDEVGGKTILKTNEVETPTTVVVTVTGEHNGKQFADEITITVAPLTDYDHISIADAIAAEEGEIVTVEGIVAASLVNKVGFFIIDETGMIAVELSQTELEGVSLGNKVVITGTRDFAGRKYDSNDGTILTSHGQSSIRDAEVVINFYGEHEYSTDNFVHGKTLSDLMNLDILEDHSTTVYVIDVIIVYTETPYYTRYEIEDPVTGQSTNIYSSSGSQLRFLQPVQGETVTIEFTAVNWNGNGWRAALLSYTFEGEKVINDSNFR